MKRTGRVSILWPSLAVLLFAVLLQFQVIKVATAGLQYDDGYNATVAKNLAMGYGYATSYGQIEPFNAEVTTGFPMILPAAGLIWLFGNQHWVPGLAAVLLMDILLLLVWWQVRAIFLPASRARVATFALLGFLFFTTETFGTGKMGFLRVWFELIGEVPAALLVALSCLLIERWRREGRVSQLIFSGLALGLAIQTKMVAYFALPGVLLAVLLIALRERSFVRGILPSALLLGLALAPGGVWEGVKYFSAKDEAAWASSQEKEKIVRDQSGSGIGQFKESPSKAAFLVSNLANNGSILVQGFSGWVFFSALLALLALGVGFAWGGGQVAGGLLVFVFATHLGWWLFLSPTGWSRHLVPGLIEGICGLAFVLADRKERWVSYVAAALFVLLAVPKLPEMRALFQLPEESPRLAWQLATRDFLNKPRNAVLIGCGWWVARDLEYLLPGVNNFRDCYGEVFTPPGADLWLVRSDIWNWDHLAELNDLEKGCDKNLLFEAGTYRVSSCRDLPTLKQRGSKAF